MRVEGKGRGGKEKEKDGTNVVRRIVKIGDIDKKKDKRIKKGAREDVCRGKGREWEMGADGKRKRIEIGRKKKRIGKTRVGKEEKKKMGRELKDDGKVWVMGERKGEKRKHREKKEGEENLKGKGKGGRRWGRGEEGRGRKVRRKEGREGKKGRETHEVDELATLLH